LRQDIRVGKVKEDRDRLEELLTVDDLSKNLKVSRVWIYKLVREKRMIAGG